ncbi:MAG: ATP-binding cassette domain-containing protein [Clostridiales bacterium]
MNILVDIEKQFEEFYMKMKFNVDGKNIGLLGASGSGKSMTLKLIAGLEKPDRGIIKIGNKTLFDSDKLINISVKDRKVGFLFQNYALFPNMTIRENIGFALNSIEKNKRNKIIKDKTNQVKLNGMENRLPIELSGGQQQRVALARALAVNPEILMFDEPFSALDENLRSYMVKEIKEVLNDFKGTSILVSHNIDEIYRLSDKIIVIDSGKVEAVDDKNDLFLNPPNIITAKLTGCKNIIKVNQISENEVMICEWGIKLKVNNKFNKKITSIGIRANHIKCGELLKESKNIIKCEIAYINESPFKLTVYLIAVQNSLNKEKYNIQLEVSKDMWNEIKNKNKFIDIYLDPEKIMLF